MCKNVFVFCLVSFLLVLCFLFSTLNSQLNFYVVYVLIPIIHLRLETASDLRLRDIYRAVDNNMLVGVVLHLIRYIEVIHIRVSRPIGDENAQQCHIATSLLATKGLETRVYNRIAA